MDTPPAGDAAQASRQDTEQHDRPMDPEAAVRFAEAEAERYGSDHPRIGGYAQRVCAGYGGQLMAHCLRNHH